MKERAMKVFELAKQAKGYDIVFINSEEENIATKQRQKLYCDEYLVDYTLIDDDKTAYIICVNPIVEYSVVVNYKEGKIEVYKCFQVIHSEAL